MISLVHLAWPFAIVSHILSVPMMYCTFDMPTRFFSPHGCTGASLTVPKGTLGSCSRPWDSVNSSSSGGSLVCFSSRGMHPSFSDSDGLQLLYLGLSKDNQGGVTHG